MFTSLDDWKLLLRKLEDTRDIGARDEGWQTDELRALIARVETVIGHTHRPAYMDPGHTACGLVVNRFPVDVPLRLGDGETCPVCTHVVAQIIKASTSR